MKTLILSGLFFLMPFGLESRWLRAQTALLSPESQESAEKGFDLTDLVSDEGKEPLAEQEKAPKSQNSRVEKVDDAPPVMSPGVVPGISQQKVQSGLETPELNVPRQGKTVSAGGRFVIYGESSRDRSAMAKLSEELEASETRILGAGSSAKTQIVISIRSGIAVSNRRGAHAHIRAIHGGGFHLALEVFANQHLQREELEREMFRVMLMERMLRGTKEIPESKSEIFPAWVMEGVLGTIQSRRHGRSSKIFSMLFQQGKVMAVQDILQMRVDHLDTVSRSFYAASCEALISSLLQQENGLVRLDQMMREIPASHMDSLQILTKHYPEVANDRRQLEKWWSLEVANLSQPTLSDVMNAQQSEEELIKLLSLDAVRKVKRKKTKSSPQGPTLASASMARSISELPPEFFEEDALPRSSNRRGWKKWIPKWLGGSDEAPSGGPDITGHEPLTLQADEEYEEILDSQYRLDEFDDLPEIKGFNQVLGERRLGLEAQTVRVHPLYRPLFQGYAKGINLLLNGEKKQARMLFGELKGRHENIRQRAQDVEDYFDWYEATQDPHLSGEFQHYFQSLKDPRLISPGASRDLISLYLDYLEKEYQ